MSAVNKDEAFRCLDLARAALASGNYDKAQRMADKSFRLFPTDEAKLLLETLQRAKSASTGPSPSNGDAQRPSANGLHHRSTASSAAHRTAQEEDRSAQATPEQREVVNRIRATKCFYEILSISKDATDDDIKKAYRKLALKLHPDKNCAKGADEAFKAVSRAFATLSDPEKRKQYDLYGTDDPQQLRRTRSHAQGFDDIDPDMIFQMFFNGAFPSGRYNVYRQQFGGQRRAAQQQQASPMAQFLSLVPVLMLFLIMTFNSMSSEPAYALDRDEVYNVPLATREYQVPFYVRNVNKFEKDYPINTNKRLRAEREVEAVYRERVQAMCHQERLQKQRLARWGYADKAREYPLKSCDELWERFRQKPTGYYYM